ncbi:MAG TPA: hypothetical protein VNT52_13745, partial [Acidimicrobiales bacterium]|nr:hypothetical protein [Acidimicrobiales bacterium]
QDNQLITIAFGPENQDIPKPPSERNLDNLTDVAPPIATTTTTSVDPNAATTSSSTSTTTAPTTTSTSTP